jgi:hypothetical protein
MISEQYTELINKLLSKTIEKKIQWQKSSSQGEFKLQLTIGTLTINKYDESYNNSAVVTINIYNNSGDKIDTLYVEDSAPEYKLLDSFYSSIRRSYYRVDETIQGFFSELDTDKIIGMEGAPEEDDLPF